MDRRRFTPIHVPDQRILRPDRALLVDKLVEISTRLSILPFFVCEFHGFAKGYPFKVLILLYFHISFKKLWISCKKRLRVWLVNLRTPLAGGAEAHNGGSDGQRSEALERV